jgi:hypothetical protein
MWSAEGMHGLPRLYGETVRPSSGLPCSLNNVQVQRLKLFVELLGLRSLPYYSMMKTSGAGVFKLMSTALVGEIM